MLVLLPLHLTRPLRALSLRMGNVRGQDFREGRAMPQVAAPACVPSEVMQLHQSFAELMQFLEAQFRRVRNQERLRRELLACIHAT